MSDHSDYPRYDYFHPNHRRARAGADARSDGSCQGCGMYPATEAHHWARCYPRVEDVTADDLTSVCDYCHDTDHDFVFFVRAGGSPEDFRVIVSEALAAALLRRLGIRRSARVGKPRRLSGGWGALVGGGSRPRPGEEAWLFLYSKRTWSPVVVIDVVGGRPGCWLVRKRWSDTARPVSIAGNAAA